MYVRRLEGVTRVSVSGAGYWPGHGRWWLGQGPASRRWITVSVMPDMDAFKFLRAQEQLMTSCSPNTLRYALADLRRSTGAGQDSVYGALKRGEALFAKEVELSLIISAANEDDLPLSRDAYRDSLLRRIELLQKTKAASISALVVRGSQRPAWSDVQLQRQVDERYLQACTILREADIPFWLVADLYGESQQVLAALDFKLSLQPACVVVQPIKHWAGVTRETRAGLAERLQRIGGKLQLVQLEETAGLIAHHRRKQGDPRVGAGGRDLYVYDPELPGLVDSLGSQEIEQLNVGIARWVLGPFLKNNKPNDAWWTRVGMGVNLEFAKRLVIVDTMVPLFESDLAEPMVKAQVLAYLERSKQGFSDAELRRWLQDEKLYAYRGPERLGGQ